MSFLLTKPHLSIPVTLERVNTLYTIRSLWKTFRRNVCIEECVVVVSGCQSTMCRSSMSNCLLRGRRLVVPALQTVSRRAAAIQSRDSRSVEPRDRRPRFRPDDVIIFFRRQVQWPGDVSSWTASWSQGGRHATAATRTRSSPSPAVSSAVTQSVLLGPRTVGNRRPDNKDCFENSSD